MFPRLPAIMNQRGSRSVRDVAATALGKTTGLHAMLCGLQLSMLA